MVKQNSRINWLESGDFIARFFHLTTHWRKAKNQMIGVTINGELCEDLEVVKKGIKAYYAEKLKEKIQFIIGLGNVEFSGTSDEDNQPLTKEFSEEEVKIVVWKYESNKSSGSNGFNFNFMKKLCNKIKGDILNDINCFFSTRIWPVECNSSFLAPIPKCDNP